MTRKCFSGGLLLLLFMIAQVWLEAEVAAVSPQGFQVKTTLRIEAPREQVYKALVNVGSWWDPAHTFFGKAANLSIEDRAQGCFCERAEKGEVRHLTVIFAAPGRALRLEGALGPLQELGVTGSMGISLRDVEGATGLDFSYSVGGYAPKGLDGWAPAVDSVLMAQLQRLKSFVETGSPTRP